MATATAVPSGSDKTGWWVAGILAALMIGGAGTFYTNLRSPSQAQVDLVQDRQQIVLQRLATIDERLRTRDLADDALREEIARVRDLIEKHVSR